MAKKKEDKIGEYSVVIIKPDGVRKRIIGEVVSRFEKVGLKLAAAKLIWVDKNVVGQHYKDDKDYLKSIGNKTLETYRKYGFDAEENLGTKKPVEIGGLVRKWSMEFMSAGPVFAMLWEGPNAVKLIRKITGFSFPFDAAPGTIRGDFALDSAVNADIEKRAVENIIHASGDEEEAEFERKLWFKEEEIYSY